MRIFALLCASIAVLWLGCAIAGRPGVEVEIVNRSARDLKDAEARFGDHVCRWGSVARKTSASYMYYPHPITSGVNLRWWEEGRGQRSEAIDLIGIYHQGRAGRLAFIVTDEGATATFHAK